MPGFIKSKEDERLWQKAKDIAAESGHKEDWPYVTGVYKKMHGGKVASTPLDSLPTIGARVVALNAAAGNHEWIDIKFDDGHRITVPILFHELPDLDCQQEEGGPIECKVAQIDRVANRYAAPRFPITPRQMQALRSVANSLRTYPEVYLSNSETVIIRSLRELEQKGLVTLISAPGGVRVTKLSDDAWKLVGGR